MDYKFVVGIVGSILVTLLSGGLIGAIYTGKATKAAVLKTASETLENYQKIANIASASELKAHKDRELADERYEQIIATLEIEKNEYRRENIQLKKVLSSWSDGIKILHAQINKKEENPNWSPNVDDLGFFTQ